MVSNAAEVEAIAAGCGIRRTRFAETLPMSTYLTALVAGDYHRVTADRRWAGTTGSRPPCSAGSSVAEHLDAEAIFAVTASGFEVFEKHFGHPYPFGKYDQVFVPEYNGGAMENVGCVTFRDEYLFRSKVTQASLRLPPGHDPARAVAHVVRRSGHHALVGRPVAEGVLRDLGRLLRGQRAGRRPG